MKSRPFTPDQRVVQALRTAESQAGRFADSARRFEACAIPSLTAHAVTQPPPPTDEELDDELRLLAAASLQLYEACVENRIRLAKARRKDLHVEQ